MTDRPSTRLDDQDMPWNDVPSDSDVVPGREEPDPAEVMQGEDDDAETHDLAAPRTLDPDHIDTLDERLAEEEPERPLRGKSEPEGRELQATERGGDDVYVGEDEDDSDEPMGDAAAEDAAIHVIDEDDVERTESRGPFIPRDEEADTLGPLQGTH
jgi:hypothetical protein